MTTLTHQSERQRVDKKFVKLVKKKFPNKSFREATRELNRTLEDMLFGKEK